MGTGEWESTMQNYYGSTIKVGTHRDYDGSMAGTYLSSFEECGQFMEPQMTAWTKGENKRAHMRSVVNDFGDLVCVRRYD